MDVQWTPVEGDPFASAAPDVQPVNAQVEAARQKLIPGNRGMQINAEMRAPKGKPQPIFPLEQATPAVQWQPVEGDPFAAPKPVSDVSNLLGQGAAAVVQGVTYPLDKLLGGKLGKAFEEHVGRNLNDIMNDVQEHYQSQLSPEQQAAGKKEFVSSKEGETLGEAWTDPKAYKGLIVSNLPSMLPGFGAAALASRGARVYGTAAARAAMEAGAAPAAAAKIGQEAAVKAATRIGAIAGAATEGIIGGGQQGAQTEQEIMALPEDKLQQSAFYQGLLRTMSPKEARQQIASDAGTQAMLVAGAIDGVTGGAFDAYLAKVLTGGGSGKLMREIGHGMAREGVTEAVQSGGEQLATNAAVRAQADPTRPLGEGVANQAVSGGIAGAAMGGGSGGAAHIGSTTQPEASQPSAAPAPAAVEPSAPAGPAPAPLALGHQAGEPLIVFPDGTTMTRAEYEREKADGIQHAAPLPLPPIDQARADAQVLKGGNQLADADETRIKNATLLSVYGENAAVRHVIEGGQQFAAIGDAMLMAAPTVERVRGTIQNHERARDVSTDILQAVDEITRLKAEGLSVAQVMAEGVSHDISFEGQQLMQFLNENAGNAKRISAFLENYLQEVENATGQPSEVRGRAFDIIQERNAARAKEEEKAKDEAFAKAEKEARRAKKQTEHKAVEENRASKIAQEMAKAKAAGSGLNPAHKSAMEIAFENARSLKGKPNVQGPGGSKPVSKGPSGGTPNGSGQPQKPAGQPSGAVSQPAQAGDQRHTRSVRPVVDQKGAGAAAEGSKDSVNRGASIASELHPVDAAAHEAATSPKNELPAPTEAQLEAGNYPKGHANVGGLDISIENPAGSHRRPEWPKLESHYGYVKDVPARAPDKEHVDVFVKPGTPEDYNGPVFVVDQNKANGHFDEPKSMVGYATEKEARAAYLKNYTKGWESRVRGITEMTMGQFKAKLQDADAFMRPQGEEMAPGLRSMTTESGWAQIGGKLLRDGEGASAEEIAMGWGHQVGNITGRTEWIPNVEWFAAMRKELGNKGLSGKAAIAATVEKRIAGEKLNANEQRTVDWMILELKRERDEYAFEQQVQDDALGDVTVEELLAEALEPSGENLIDMDLSATARELDPDAFERATMQFADDDAGFMAAVKEIINVHKSPEAGTRGEEGHGAETGATRPALDLAGQTEAEAAAEAQRLKQIEDDKARADAKAESDAKQARVAAEIKSRQAASAENFELGQSAEDSLAGQKGIDLSESKVQYKNDEVPADARGVEIARNTAEQFDLFSAAPVSNIQGGEDVLGIVVEPVKRGELHIGYETIDDTGKAAHAFAALRKSPREVFQLLVLDKDKKPIASWELFKGTVTQTSVYPREVISAAYSTPGAAYVWYAHNHPSGMAMPSRADEPITGVIYQAGFKDTGIKSLGHIIVAGRRAAVLASDGTFDGGSFEIPPASRKFSVPILERTVKKSSRLLPDALSSPSAARDAVTSIAKGRTGLVLMDAQHFPTGWITMSVTEMAKLRTNDAETGAGRLFKMIARNNAAAAMAVTSDEASGQWKHAVANIGQALSGVDVKMLDSFSMEDGRLASGAERGDSMQSGGAWFSRNASDGGIHIADLRALSKSIKLAYHVNPAASIAEWPADLRQMVEDAPHNEGIDAAFYGGEIWLAGDRLPNLDIAQNRILHEATHGGLRGLFGDKISAQMVAIHQSNENVKDRVAQMRERMPKLSVVEATEEVLVDMAANGEAAKLNGWPKFVAWIRDWLRAHGFAPSFVDHFSDNDVLLMLQRAAEVAEGKRTGQNRYTGYSAFSTKYSRTAQTLTKAFRDWFGASKVVDKDGKPLVVYHATGEDFTKFDMGRANPNSMAGAGAYFTDSKTASRYASRIDEGAPNLRPVYLSLKNPLDARTADGKQLLDDALIVDHNLEDDGYDGIIFNDKDYGQGGGDHVSYVAFHPEQIKSAIGNTGAFSPSNPDIRFSRGASETFKAAKGTFTEKLDAAKQAGYKATATRIVDRVDQVLNPLGTLPEQSEYLTQRYLAQGLIEQADESAKGIRDAFTDASETDKQAIYEYFSTANADSNGIADGVIRLKAEQIKAEIGKVGDQLVDKGLLSAESREQYKDAYLPRLYLKHLLSTQDWKALGAGKKPSDMGYLKARKDIPDEVRKVILGEITDPGFLASVAIAKPARDMALLDWLAQIAGNKNWILPGGVVPFTSPLTGKTMNVTPFWLKEEAVRMRKQARYYEAPEAAKAEAEAKAMDQVADDALEDIQGNHADYKALPNTARYGRLRGMFVRTEIYNDLMGVNDFLPSDPGWFQNIFGYGGVGTKATQIWKAMKVSMNPPAQVRNFVSNGIMMQMSGVPLRLVPARVLQAVDEIRTNGPHYQVAKKYGVGVSTFATQEVFRMKTELLDLELKTRGMGALGRMHRIAALLMNKASDFYQLSETIFKTGLIIDGMKRQGMTEEKAVQYANTWLFDYSLIQKSVRYARNAPIGVPFLTYSVKVLPRLIEVAALHPQRLIPWVSLFYGFPMLVASMLGVDKDDLDRLKMALPEWLRDKGHALILPFKDDNGRWQVVDLSYFMPWSNWTQLAGDIAKGEPGKAIQDAGIFGGPITDIIVAIKTGKDPFTGRDIYAKGDPPERQMIALMNYIWNMAAPPFLTDRGLVSPLGLLDKAYGGKAVQALTGTTNKFGEPRSTAEQAMLYLAGINVNAITPEFTRTTNVQVMERDMQDVKRQMVQKLQDRSLTPEQRRDIATEYATELVRRGAKLQKYLQDSRISPTLH